MKRKFLEAALRYYDISQIEQRKIGDEYVSTTKLNDSVVKRFKFAYERIKKYK